MGSGVHFQSPGLLQLGAVRHHRQPYPTSEVSSECCRQHGQVGVNTSYPFCGNYIGCRFNAVPSSSWLHWCTRHFTTLHRRMSLRCQLVSDVDRRLRSSAALSCVVPRTKTRPGDRSFDVAGPRIWNKLPTSMRLIEDFGHFKRLLKAY